MEALRKEAVVRIKLTLINEEAVAIWNDQQQRPSPFLFALPTHLIR